VTVEITEKLTKYVKSGAIKIMSRKGMEVYTYGSTFESAIPRHQNNGAAVKLAQTIEKFAASQFVE